MKNKTIIINLFGAPCSGKSTVASYLFYKLKTIGYKCELVTEFAKDKTYENNETALSDQIFMFANQNYRINQIIKNENLSFIITDSPLLLNIIYNKDTYVDRKLNELVKAVFDSHNNFNIFLTRGEDYQTYGRNQTKEEADLISYEIFHKFYNNIDFITEKERIEDDFSEILRKITNRGIVE